jgi:uncharacterized protein (DUF1501 family)
MKVFNLACEHGHLFEGWFASHTAFDEQLAGGKLQCPLCGSVTVRKKLSAPRLNLSVAQASQLAAALSAVPDFPISNAENELAAQLRVVARMIAARAALGAKRQVFFVQLNGFDTHNSQLETQPALHLKVGEALKYFYDTLNTLQIGNQVTTFTASDFGRTLSSNGDGSDHGYGSHHMIMGGAVQGKRFYGTFPELGIGSPDDVGQGRTVPTTAVDQYAATLARWFGVTSQANLQLVLPNIGEFANNNLGFMG